MKICCEYFGNKFIAMLIEIFTRLFRAYLWPYGFGASEGSGVLLEITQGELKTEISNDF